MRIVPVLAALCCVATSASAFRSLNGLSVVQTGPTEFTVDYRISFATSDYWCAAGDFAIRVLGLPGPTRIYRVSPSPRSAGEGITFSLDPAIGTAETGITSLGSGRGEKSISAGVAQASYCYNIDLPFPFD